MSEIIYLSNVRLSFPHLVEAHSATENGVKKYSADFIMSPDHPGFAQFMAHYTKLATDKWAEHAQNVMGLINGDRKLRCYGGGNEKIDKKTFQPYSGYAGMVYIGANRDVMPQMVQDDGKPVDPANMMANQVIARKLYGGCFVNAAIKPWIQDNKHGRGIRCELVAIQFYADGEAFGEGAVDVSSMFGAVATQPAAPAAPGFAMPSAPFPGFMS
jgi:hypothetical protein